MFSFFFFNDTATTEIYTLSLHDALPIWVRGRRGGRWVEASLAGASRQGCAAHQQKGQERELSHHALLTKRSEEHTSELQSRLHLVCRLLLEKKKHNHTVRHSRSPHSSCA